MSRPSRPNFVLAVLFTGAFVMGCAEMLVVGMIDLIAADLTVSVPAAGALVTANALGLAIGGPLLTFLTTRFDRRPVLLAATTVFVLANLLPALASHAIHAASALTPSFRNSGLGCPFPTTHPSPLAAVPQAWWTE